MRSLVLEGTRRLAWREVPEPHRRHEGEAIVRPLAVATCDLDQPMIFGQTPFQFPIHLGHVCVAEVVEGPKAHPQPQLNAWFGGMRWRVFRSVSRGEACLGRGVFRRGVAGSPHHCCSSPGRSRLHRVSGAPVHRPPWATYAVPRRPVLAGDDARPVAPR
jgi:hypothetical protein